MVPPNKTMDPKTWFEVVSGIAQKHREKLKEVEPNARRF